MHPAESIPEIVLVEDTEDDAFFFNHALRAAGLPYKLRHFIDGAATVDFLDKVAGGHHPDVRLPDLIFLDLKLPGMSGFEVLTWIREREFNPRLHVVILSGSEQQSDIDTTRELGAEDYVVKPIQTEDLRHRLLALSKLKEPRESVARH